MRAVVIYESMFGNTKRIAEAIAAVLSEHMRTEIFEVADAPKSIDVDIDLLVVGGPTHAFGMTRHSTREQARQQASFPIVSQDAGVREWLADVDIKGSNVRGAAFCTRAATRSARIAIRRSRSPLTRHTPPTSMSSIQRTFRGHWYWSSGGYSPYRTISSSASLAAGEPGGHGLPRVTTPDRLRDSV